MRSYLIFIIGNICGYSPLLYNNDIDESDLKLITLRLVE